MAGGVWNRIIVSDWETLCLTVIVFCGECWCPVGIVCECLVGNVFIRPMMVLGEKKGLIRMMVSLRECLLEFVGVWLLNTNTIADIDNTVCSYCQPTGNSNNTPEINSYSLFIYLYTLQSHGAAELTGCKITQGKEFFCMSLKSWRQGCNETQQDATFREYIFIETLGAEYKGNAVLFWVFSTFLPRFRHS